MGVRSYGLVMRKRVGVIIRATANTVKRFFALFSPSTVSALVGILLTSYGLLQLYEPLAYIIPGLMLLAFGLWLAGMFSRTG